VFEALDESLQQQLLTQLLVAATDSEISEVASAAGRVVKKVVLNSKLVAEQLEKMNNARVKHQPVVSPGGMVLRSRR
jgi:predicted nucleic acid-binding protein